jgi:hypothetical protein
VGVTGEKRIILFDLLDFSPLALVKQRHSVIELGSSRLFLLGYSFYTVQREVVW